MSRSGYSDYWGEAEAWAIICWTGAAKSAIRGRRGQALLRDMLAAFDALPAPRLIDHALEREGEVCALGAVGRLRGLDMTTIDPEDREEVALAFDIAGALAAEIAYVNDEGSYVHETPEQRFTRVRAWVLSTLREA